MTRDRLMYHLENWRNWMHAFNSRLGYPSKSLGMSSGGASGADEFDIMADESDKVSAKAMDGIIESITAPQKVAINHEWLKNKHFYPTHDMDLEEAYGNIMRLADKRGLY